MQRTNALSSGRAAAPILAGLLLAFPAWRRTVPTRWSAASTS